MKNQTLLTIAVVLVIFCSCNRQKTLADDKIYKDSLVVDSLSNNKVAQKSNDTSGYLDSPRVDMTGVETILKARYLLMKSECESKGLDFCDVYNQIKEINIEGDRKAQKLFPTDYKKVIKYNREYMDKKLKVFYSKNGLTDTVFQKTLLVGLVYCK